MPAGRQVARENEMSHPPAKKISKFDGKSAKEKTSLHRLTMRPVLSGTVSVLSVCPGVPLRLAKCPGLSLYSNGIININSSTKVPNLFVAVYHLWSYFVAAYHLI